MLKKITSFILGSIIKYRRDVVQTNLTYCFPKWSENQIQDAIDQYYDNLSSYLIDGILPHSESTLNARIHYNNLDLLEHSASQNTIILASHLGNWELITPYLSAQIKKQTYGIYMPIKTTWIDTYIKNKRGKYGLNLIAMEKIVRQLAQPDPKVITFILDQSPPLDGQASTIEFLGRKTRWYNSIDKINEKYDCTFYYQRVIPQGDNYKIAYIPLRREQVLLQYVNLLEEDVVHHPTYWLWSHNRWKGMNP